MQICPECNMRTEEKICPKCKTHTLNETLFIESKKESHSIVGKKLVERYMIDELIGEGGMAFVYKATHLTMGSVCAIKILKKELVSSIEQVKRFHREALIASKLSHPNTIRVYDYGQTDDGRLFIVMEYLKGRTLREILKEEKILNCERAVGIILQVAKALLEAHEMGMIHRDLKPENIFVRRFGGEDIVKVLDFGISKAIIGEETESLTRTGIIVGSPQYMSPEQARDQEIDFRTDLYALGIILYEMITGKPPFREKTPSAILVSHVIDPVPSIEEKIQKNVPQELKNLIFSLLEKQKEKRPKNVSEVISILKSIPFKKEKTLIEEKVVRKIEPEEEQTILIKTPEVTHPIVTPSKTLVDEKVRGGIKKYIIGGVLISILIISSVFGLKFIGKEEKKSEVKKVIKVLSKEIIEDIKEEKIEETFEEKMGKEEIVEIKDVEEELPEEIIKVVPKKERKIIKKKERKIEIPRL